MPGLLAIEQRSAEFSPCRTYRYRLIRRWAEGPMLNVIGLNPSTADETQDDPTVRRCMGFAKAWGYSGLIMTNLCAFRATDPADLAKAGRPLGPRNDVTLYREAKAAGLVLAAWGAHPLAVAQGRWVVQDALSGVELRCLGLTKVGAPRHPLYVPASTPHVAFEAR